MRERSKKRELLFQISDAARLLRTRADQVASRTGLTKAQWSVLLRLERMEGLMQADLANELDIQPITLTRLLDRLCENGLVERRPDPNDRRAKRLFLTEAARPLLEQVAVHVEELADEVLAGLEPADIELLLNRLQIARDNTKQAIERNTLSNKVASHG